MQKTAYILLLLSLYSCSFFNKKDTVNHTGKPIAKVNNTFLYKEDLVDVLPENYKEGDSVLIVHNFINSWAKKQLLLFKAQQNLSEEINHIDRLVKKYKEDLLIDKYRSAVVNQELDTTVSEAAIDSFYLKNKETLILNEELLKLKFIQMDKNINDRITIEKLFKSSKKEDFDSLIEKELEFRSFYFNDSVWVKYSEVLKEIPLLEKKDIQNIPNKGKHIIKENEQEVYLIQVNAILNRNSISPLNYVKPTIKQMILHTRKLKVLKKIEKTLLNDANKNGQYEIFK